jgi:hypothetical protein
MRFASSKEQAAQPKKNKRTGLILVCSYCSSGFHRLAWADCTITLCLIQFKVFDSYCNFPGSFLSSAHMHWRSLTMTLVDSFLSVPHREVAIGRVGVSPVGWYPPGSNSQSPYKVASSPGPSPASSSSVEVLVSAANVAEKGADGASAGT